MGKSTLLMNLAEGDKLKNKAAYCLVEKPEDDLITAIANAIGFDPNLKNTPIPALIFTHHTPYQPERTKSNTPTFNMCRVYPCRIMPLFGRSIRLLLC